MAHEVVPGELARYVDDAPMRYRRILLPLLGNVLGLGKPVAVDVAYMAAGFFFVFLGMWWMAGYAVREGLHPGWAALFALVPASMIFVDRMTVDHLLGALCVGFVIYAARKPGWEMYIILALAPLARETGLFLTFAYCCYWLLRRNLRLAVIYGTSAIPAAAWFLYLASKVGLSTYPNTWVPLQSLFRFMFRPVEYPADVPLVRIVQLSDSIAHAGMLVALALAVVWMAKNRRPDPVTIAMALFALLTIFMQKSQNWATVYNFGRIYGPLLVFVAMAWLPRNRWLAALPLVMVAQRVVVEHGRQIQGIVYAVLGI
jgi:hypothetical protein